MNIEDAIAGMTGTAILGFLAGFWIALRAKKRKMHDGAATKADLVPLRRAAQELHAAALVRASGNGGESPP